MVTFYTQQEGGKDMNMAVYTETETERNKKIVFIYHYLNHISEDSVSHINDTLPSFLYITVVSTIGSICMSSMYCAIHV